MLPNLTLLLTEAKSKPVSQRHEGPARILEGGLGAGGDLRLRGVALIKLF